MEIKRFQNIKVPYTTQEMYCVWDASVLNSVGPKFFLRYTLEKIYSLLTSWVRIIFLWVRCRSKSFPCGYYVLLCIMRWLMYYFVFSALRFWANPTLFLILFSKDNSKHIALDTTFCLIINNLIYVNFNLGVTVSITHNTAIQQSYFWWSWAISLE